MKVFGTVALFGVVSAVALAGVAAAKTQVNLRDAKTGAGAYVVSDDQTFSLVVDRGNLCIERFPGKTTFPDVVIGVDAASGEWFIQTGDRQNVTRTPIPEKAVVAALNTLCDVAKSHASRE